MTRAELVEQVAKIIAPPFTFSDGTQDEDWREYLDRAEQIVDLLRPETGEKTDG
jgi:hypothetical protein